MYVEEKGYCPELAFFWWGVLFSFWKYFDQSDDYRSSTTFRQNRMPRQPRRKGREHPGQSARHPSSSSMASSRNGRHTGSVFSKDKGKSSCGCSHEHKHEHKDGKAAQPPKQIISCPVCSTEITEANVVHCIRCLTVHHRECFEYFGECATYGCGMYRCRDGFPSPAQGSKRAQRTWVAKTTYDVFGNVKTKLIPEALGNARVNATKASAESKIRIDLSRQRLDDYQNYEPPRAASFSQQHDNPDWIRSLPHLLYLFFRVLIIRTINAILDGIEEDRLNDWPILSTLLSILIVLLPFILLGLLLNYPQTWLMATLLLEGGLVTCKLGIVARLI